MNARRGRITSVRECRWDRNCPVLIEVGGLVEYVQSEWNLISRELLRWNQALALSHVV
jgi:hypothetical protein